MSLGTVLSYAFPVHVPALGCLITCTYRNTEIKSKMDWRNYFSLVSTIIIVI